MKKKSTVLKKHKTLMHNYKILEHNYKILEHNYKALEQYSLELYSSTVANPPGHALDTIVYMFLYKIYRQGYIAGSQLDKLLTLKNFSCKVGPEVLQREILFSIEAQNAISETYEFFSANPDFIF
jgi:hypothetical protein